MVSTESYHWQKPLRDDNFDFSHLRQELTVQDSLVVGEPVPLHLPQFDLINDGGRQGLLALGLQHLGVSVLLEVADYLIRSYAPSESLSHRLARYEAYY